MVEQKAKKSGFSLIGVLLIIGVLVITAGGVVVWEERKEKLTPPTIPSPTPEEATPSNSIPVNPRYLSDESYCEKDNDCTARPACCNPCYREFVNIYHKDSIPRNQCTKFCPQDCPDPEFFSGKPVCRENQCTSSTSPVSCQTGADCPPVIGVCMPGKCPTYQCLNGRCVFFEDAMVLRACLEEATLQECSERYGR